MAVLYELLAGASAQPPPAGRTEPADTAALGERQPA
jgi:hypothetical protein